MVIGMVKGAKKLEVLTTSGAPLFIYDLENMRIDKDTLLATTGDLTLRSSLLVAALQALAASGGNLHIAETDEGKHLFVQKDEIVVHVLLSKDVDPYYEKYHYLAHGVAAAVVQLHEELNIDPTLMLVNDYLEEVGTILDKFIKRLLQRLHM